MAEFSITTKTQQSGPPPPYEASQQQVVYNPVGIQNETTILITQPVQATVVAPISVGPQPVNMTCPYCQAQILTSIRFKPGILTWLACGGIVVVGLTFGCCLIPSCIDDLKDCHHTCPNCNNLVGIYRRMC